MTALRQPVVVGYDGSPEADRALVWAVGHARALGVPLRVCIARGDLYRLSAWADEWTADLAREWGDRARGVLRGVDAADTGMDVVDGRPAPALIDRSSPGSLLVVGSRGAGLVAGTMLGSVAQHVVRHARGPVVVVRQPARADSRTVLVGADDSEQSLVAVDWAAELAEARGLDLCVLHCPDPPVATTGPDADAVLAHLPRLREREERLRARVEQVREARPGLAVELRISQDDARSALRDGSDSAALVVVGACGRGAFTGLLLGSVSAGTVAHARCPVAVIR